MAAAKKKTGSDSKKKFGPKSRIRNWIVVDYDAVDLTTLGSNLVYWIYGNEVCPTTGRDHRQSYIELRVGLTRSDLKNKIGSDSIHLEPRWGPQSNAIDYTKKGKQSHEEWEEFNTAGPTYGLDADVYEFGKPKEQGKRVDLEEIMDFIKNGGTELEVAENWPSQWMQYGRRFERYRKLVQPRRTWITKVECVWGPTGSGKTRWATELGGKIIDYSRTEFIQGYQNEEIVIFDEFRPDSMRYSFFLKITDRYDISVNIKNDEMRWNPKMIIFLSEDDPQFWYGSKEAFLRRVNIRHIKDIKNKST